MEDIIMKKNIKKWSFFGLAFTCAIELYPTIAMDEPDTSEAKINVPLSMNIGDITPVKDGMTKAEAENAIYCFLKTEVFKLENEIDTKDIKEDKMVKFSGAIREKRLFTLKDGTEWVQGDGGLERLLGALYLEKAIEHNNLKKWQVVKTKFILKDVETIKIKIKKSQDNPLKNIFTIDSNDFVTVSQYVGDKKPDIDTDFISTLTVFQTTTGFTDCDPKNNFPNLRVQEGRDKIIVIDTEYGSFSNKDKIGIPSQQTELDLGGAMFTFTAEDFWS